MRKATRIKKESSHKATSFTSRRRKKLNRRSSQTVSEKPCIWKLQTSDQQFLRNKHYAEVHHGVARTRACSQMPYPQFWRLHQKTFAWTSKRPCARQLSTKIACETVSFATIGWTNRQRTTHPDQLDWSIALYGSKNKRNYSNDNSVLIVIKLLKTLAVKTTQASELGTVATSNNRQQRHGQLQWARSIPSIIVMESINAIIAKGQSARETSVRLTRRGEPWWWASEPQGGIANERDKGVVRTLWVSQQYSSRNDNHCQRSINCCNLVDEEDWWV